MQVAAFIPEGFNPGPGIDPIFAYNHTIGPTGGCAITGGDFGFGGYLFADFCSGWIRRLDLNTNTASNFSSGGSSIVDLAAAAGGGVYYLQQGGTNRLFLIEADAVGTPEPTSLLLSGVGLLALGAFLRRKR